MKKWLATAIAMAMLAGNLAVVVAPAHALPAPSTQVSAANHHDDDCCPPGVPGNCSTACLLASTCASNPLSVVINAGPHDSTASLTLVFPFNSTIPDSNPSHLEVPPPRM